MSAHLFGGCAAVGVAAFHGAARREQREEVFAYFGDDGLPFGERELVHRAVVLYAPADGVADFFVRAAEGHAAQYEVFRDVGREDEAVGEAAVRLFFVDVDVREERRQDGEDELEAVERAEESALVVLEVAVVCERDAFHHREEVDERAGELARLAAQQLEHVGVLFLRHDAGAGAEGVGQLDPAEFCREVDDEVFGEAAYVVAEYGGEVEYVEEVVAVGDGVHAVFGEAREAHVAHGVFTVERQRGAGERAAAERRFVYRVVGGEQAARVAHEGLRVRHPEVAHGDGLRLLEVGVAGDDDVGVFLGLREQDVYQRFKAVPYPEQLFAQVEADCGVDLVVAAASHVEARAGRAAFFDEARFDVHVYVFERGLRLEFAALYLLRYLAQVFLYRLGFVLRQQPRVAEHAHVRDAAAYVRRGHAPVEVERLREAEHRRVHVLRETSLPHFMFSPFDE